jgi:hypothetical protein
MDKLTKEFLIKIFVIIFLLGVIVGFLQGCTVRISGEMSFMKQWDRPAESYTVKQEDSAATKPAPPAR